MKVIEGGAATAAGSLPVSTAAEVKYKNKQDMATTHSEAPCETVGTFTINIVRATPVKWGQNVVENNPFAQAVVINAGITNVCTGVERYGYCKDTTDVVTEALKIPTDTVLVASTGVAGMQLPVGRTTAGVKATAPKLDESTEGGTGAAQVITTAGTKKREVVVQVELGGKTITAGDMCKGSGIIRPNMCIMLASVATDATISKELLQEALSEDIQDTYNIISVDGGTSTNDMAFLLVSGVLENLEIIEKDKDHEIFKKALNYVNKALAREIAGDGKGCTALFEVTIVGAKSKEQAKILVKSATISNLTKAAIFGHDANWGRILCAIGYSDAIFDPKKTDLFFRSTVGKMQIIKNGVAVNYNEEQATKILSEPEVAAIADVKMGDTTVSAWGYDLTFDYVKTNADYRPQNRSQGGKSVMELEQNIMEKTGVLIEALPYIQRFNRKITVVGYGDSAMVNEEPKKHVIQNVVLLRLVDLKPIIVHGGGKEISKWINKIGMELNSVDGLRVTDEPTMETAEMMLDEVDKSLIQMVNGLGIPAVGISGKDGMILKCDKKYSEGEDIGFVGDIKEANPKVIYDLLEKDFPPVICPIGYDDGCLSYNVNADDAACAIAMAVQAEKLAFLTDMENVHYDFGGKDFLISEMTVEEAQGFMSGGSLGGGMLPRLQNCTDTIRESVSKVHILDGRIPRCLLLEMFTNKDTGTAIINVREEKLYHGK